MATDPVCGMQVDERTAALSSVFAGSKYYFCCSGCKNKFDASPSAYVGKAPGDTRHAGHTRSAEEASARGRGNGASAGVTAATIYTCPMHGEIVRGQPGDCPI